MVHLDLAFVARDVYVEPQTLKRVSEFSQPTWATMTQFTHAITFSRATKSIAPGHRKCIPYLSSIIGCTIHGIKQLGLKIWGLHAHILHSAHYKLQAHHFFQFSNGYTLHFSSISALAAGVVAATTLIRVVRSTFFSTAVGAATFFSQPSSVQPKLASAPRLSGPNRLGFQQWGSGFSVPK